MPGFHEEQELDAERLLHGECHLFAIALQRLTGLPIAAYLDTDDEVEGVVLVHAFLLDGDDAIDVRGSIPLDEVIEEFDANDPWLIEGMPMEELLAIGEGGAIDETGERWSNALKHAYEVAVRLGLLDDALIP